MVRRSQSTELQVVHSVYDLVPAFAEADHHARLGHSVGRDFLGVCQQFQRPVVIALGPDAGEHATDGLDVVVERVRLGVHDLFESVAAALEVGNENLDLGVRHTAADLTDGLREDERPAVRQIVAVDRRDHGVAQSHLLHRVGHPDRLQEVYPLGLPGIDGAVGACAGADIAQDHERGGAAIPALADVRTLGLSADGV